MQQASRRPLNDVREPTGPSNWTFSPDHTHQGPCQGVSKTRGGPEFEIAGWSQMRKCIKENFEKHRNCWDHYLNMCFWLTWYLGVLVQAGVRLRDRSVELNSRSLGVVCCGVVPKVWGEGGWSGGRRHPQQAFVERRPPVLLLQLMHSKNICHYWWRWGWWRHQCCWIIASDWTL